MGARWVAFVVASAAVLACTTKTDTSGSLVVGLQSEDLGGAIGSIHVTTTVDGVAQDDEVITASTGVPLLPREIKIDPKGNSSARVAVRVEGYPGTDATGPTTVVRTARTQMVPGQNELLRLRLESRCLTLLIGGVPGPECKAPNETCLAGQCGSDEIPTGALEPYKTNWPNDLPDLCRPLNPGDPTVVVGTGQTDYLPLTDGQIVQLEQGPQGGHHLWVALRMKNIKRSGSTTTLSAIQPGTNIEAPSTTFVFTFDGDQGGYCKLYGLRFQLDALNTDLNQFLGKPLDVKVTVKDNAGNVGSGVAHVNISSTIIGG
ncbi:hypothetical protein BH09MYX1_BH09MYX1_58420 [soil metagenome]